MQSFDSDQTLSNHPSSLESSSQRPPILDRRLFDITHGEELPNGDAGLFERLAVEVERTNWTNQEIDLFNQALEDMARIHSGDMRGDQRSHVHMLRGAIRLMSEGEQYFGVRDRPDLVIAYLLHDSVEDFVDRWLSPEQLAGLDLSTREDQLLAQQMAFRVIEQRYSKTVPEGYIQEEGDTPEYVDGPSFGTRISQVVEWMTSEPYPDDLRDGADKVEYQKRKWGRYEMGVRAIYREEDAYGAKLLKTLDIAENFIGGMRYHEDPRKRAIHARKYIFLVDTITRYIASSRIIPEERKLFQIGRFRSAFEEAKQIISNHIEKYPMDAELFDTSDRETVRVMGRTAIDISPIAS